MSTVFVAGATGYLGRHIVKQYVSMGWQVRALVRNAESAVSSGLEATALVEAEATRPETLQGAMDGVDLVISALGITRQRDGLSYMDVDYQANANLLTEALAAGVDHFAYVHVLNADKMPNVPLVAAKQAFAAHLQSSPIRSTIIAPSGFFSDMSDFLDMARSGRVWLFGTGELKMNPIDGADLASVIATEVQEQRGYVPVGGPDMLSHTELAKAAFAALEASPKITRLPDVIRRIALKLLPFVTPSHVHGPALFFLSAMGLDMVGEPHGEKRLTDHFAQLVQAERSSRTDK
ncbi:MAG: SDR family oxidoreductase [Alphaproteobacteria bacterium]